MVVDGIVYATRGDNELGLVSTHKYHESHHNYTDPEVIFAHPSHKQEADNTSYVGYKASTTARMCMKQHPEWGLHEDNTDCQNLYSAGGQSFHNTIYINRYLEQLIYTKRRRSSRNLASCNFRLLRLS